MAAFLEKNCREDNGIFQLRAVFDRPWSDGYVHVRVAFPGTASFSEVRAEAEPPPMIVEQFEVEATDDIATLKRMIQARTLFPAKRAILLLGAWRFHDNERLARVAAALDAAGAPLQFHLAASGAYVFLRREGQGHREPSGPCSLTLVLPRCVQGPQMRPMKFDLLHTLGDLRWSVQAVSGLPPAGVRLSLVAPVQISFASANGSETLGDLGFTDGCTLKVQYDLAEENSLGDAYDMPLEIPTSGDAKLLYERAAAKLGMPDPSHLALFVGSTAIRSSADLSCAPLADGTVLSALVAWSLQLSVSVLVRKSASGSSTGPSETAGAAQLQPLACLSSDTIAEVRERAIGAVAASRAETAMRLRGSKVFAVAMADWATAAESCTSLNALARLLGHFAPCGDTARLSRLGIAEGVHLVFVPDPQLLVEIEVRISGETCVVRKLRVPSTTRLSELSRLLEQDLRAQPIADRPCIENLHCQWSVPRPRNTGTSFGRAQRAQSPPPRARREALQTTPSPSLAARNVVALVGDAVAKGKRRISGSFSTEESNSKRRRHDPVIEVADSDFVGDLHSQYPAGPQEFPSHFLCPISYDLMRDPVVVVGSGNTYDRKSIEHHFTRRHSDPLTNVELRRAADRRLVPNNGLRSQVIEAERAQVDISLVASLGERRRISMPCLTDGSSGSGVGTMAASLRWCASLLRGTSCDIAKD